MSKPAATAGFMSMKGGGYYSKATIGAKHTIDRATHLILDAVERMDPADDGSTFTMSDMGCADGGTSVTMVGAVLREVRRRAPSRPSRPASPLSWPAPGSAPPPSAPAAAPTRS